MIGCRRGKDDQADLARIDTGRIERIARGHGREAGSRLAIVGDVTLADPGAFDDPFVTGVDLRGQIGIGHAIGR